MNHRDTVSKNLISLKTKKITFYIRGNTNSIELFVGLPKDFKQFFQNTFYTSFPTSDLVEVTNFQPTKMSDYIIAKEPEKILSKEKFVRDGTYMDPLPTILSLFGSIDPKSRLDISFSYTFKVKKDFFDYIKIVLMWLWDAKKKK